MKFVRFSVSGESAKVVEKLIGLSTVSELIDQRKVRFLSKCRSNMQENLLCKVCQSQ